MPPPSLPPSSSTSDAAVVCCTDCTLRSGNFLALPANCTQELNRGSDCGTTPTAFSTVIYHARNLTWPVVGSSFDHAVVAPTLNSRALQVPITRQSAFAVKNAKMPSRQSPSGKAPPVRWPSSKASAVRSPVRKTNKFVDPISKVAHPDEGCACSV